jgi:hypothetical protein
MITDTISFAPAWVPGTGSVVARPYACATALPSLIAAATGTRVPADGMARLRGTEVAGFGFVAPMAQQHDPINTQNDGTTLGIHSPGRPKS